MSRQLKLLPFANDLQGTGTNSMELLKVADGFVCDNIARIEALPALPVPPDFSCYEATGEDEESCFGVATEDAYGAPLLATTMSHLQTLGIPGPQGAYVAACPPVQRCALYWY